ncbi:hypothetical protein BC831DRAFT_487892, partial [Entophlyctis helioformis]
MCRRVEQPRGRIRSHGTRKRRRSVMAMSPSSHRRIVASWLLVDAAMATHTSSPLSRHLHVVTASLEASGSNATHGWRLREPSAGTHSLETLLPCCDRRHASHQQVGSASGRGAADRRCSCSLLLGNARQQSGVARSPITADEGMAAARARPAVGRGKRQQACGRQGRQGIQRQKHAQS